MKISSISTRGIKLLLTDVDGVLTNGKVYLSEQGDSIAFDIQDGIGHRLAINGGLKVGWISGRISKPVTLRAQKLKVPILYQGKLDKLSAAKKICQQEGLKLSQVAYVGDDLIDLPLITQVGWSATVPYGRPELKRIVDYITHAPGGGGAYREIVEKTLKAKGCWQKALRLFYQTNGHKADISHDVFE